MSLGKVHQIFCFEFLFSQINMHILCCAAVPASFTPRCSCLMYKVEYKCVSTENMTQIYSGLFSNVTHCLFSCPYSVSE